MSTNIIEEVKQNIPAILDGDSKKLVENAEKLGGHIRRLSTSQIRNIFSEVKQMHEFDRDRLILLRPKLAYTAGRHGSRRGPRLVGPIVDLQEVLDNGIQNVTTAEQFQNFKLFFEAILAYHRFHGGAE